ncbi:MAG: hypothetical protein U1F17_10435 [Burkholderiaceae bacterium]
MAEAHTEARSRALAPGEPLVGLRLQPVMDVPGDELPGPVQPDQRVEQDGGVAPAAERDEQGRAIGKPPQRLGDCGVDRGLSPARSP